MKQVRTVFMGTPKIAKTLLENILQAGISIDLVVTQPDRKVGRKQQVVYSPVKECALDNAIPVFQPQKIKEDFDPILKIQPDLIITCAYGQIVPDEVLNAPRFGCVNLHGSLLPKYRGAAPIQRAVWNQDKESGMSLMKMVSEMDAGPVFSEERILLDEEETTSSLFDKMADAASRLLIRDFDKICREDASYTEQDKTLVTYAKKISKDDERIDLSRSDQEIFAQIRALSLEPGGYVFIKKRKFKILEAHYHDQSISKPLSFLGKYKNGYGLALHNGVLEIVRCQMEGKPVVSGSDFANGQGRSLIDMTCE
ncbi:methionyl-tRNA formyltransferase [Faecalicoccus acidiformans]|uniref:methionyl-tRNA formyltransferase n=1 Tax=Faecalicoccus acidiformans TaxID=915173 RepID=UPI0023574F8B|nr:methionyl-tRNA formyltransferase [Faecalicoccus acidiformans]